MDTNNTSDIKVEKILVGITVQANSKRLITKGAEIAKQKQGQLHILHVQKGNNIFVNSHTPELLQQLYQYASQLGGETHAICGEDVCEAIANFAKNMDITTMVLGERPKHIKVDSNNDIISKIKLLIPQIDIVILERQDKQIHENIAYEHKFA